MAKKKTKKTKISIKGVTNKVNFNDKNGLLKIGQRFKFKFSKPTEIRIDEVFVDIDVFQGRSVPFASETVEKIIREGYDTTQDPIVLWKNDSGKNIVISGHSRFEAAKRTAQKNKKFQKIPVKFFNGDRDEAIDYALIESNRSGKAEGIESDIKAYTRAKERGYSREFLKSIFKIDSYINILRVLTKLDPNGEFIDILKKNDGGEKVFPYILRNATWVGSARLIYPEITNAHEKEIFSFFYKTDKGLKITKQAFFDLLKKKIETPNFSAKKPLGLGKEKEFEKIKETDTGFIRYRQIQSAINEWQTERNRKEQLFAEATISKNATVQKELTSRIKDIEKALQNKYIELINIKNQLNKEDSRLKKTGMFF